MILSVGFVTDELVDETELFRTMDGAKVEDANAPTIDFDNDHFTDAYFRSIIEDESIPF